MIVPQFKLKQSEGFVQVFIRVPYIKVTACEFYIQSNSFKFYLKPYLLSLCFQQSLKEVEEPARAVYYHDKYVLEVHLQKNTVGQHFQDLDLIANLLNNKKTKKKKGSVAVEVVGGQGGVIVDQGNNIQNSQNYGFSLNYSNVMEYLEEETAQLFEFDPKCTPLAQRYHLSHQIIIKNFDYDSFLFDKYENSQQIQSILTDKLYMTYLFERIQKLNGVEVNSTEFKVKMSTSKELLISKDAQANILRQIASICFSYIYELICMQGDFSQESAKTINKTSLVLSTNCYYYGMDTKNMLVDCFRRCLTYSLYKSLKICGLTLECLKNNISIKFFIAILQDLRGIFQRNQPRYLLNKLFIDDYLVYLYSVDKQSTHLSQLTENLSKLVIKEEDLQLGIHQYENLNNAEQIEDQIQQEKKVKLIEQFSKLDTLD